MSHPFNVVMNKVKEDATEKKSESPNFSNTVLLFSWNLKKKKKSPVDFVGKENVFEVGP